MAQATIAPKTNAAGEEPHPSGDNRFKVLEATMKRYQYQSDALIEVMHNAQQIFGFLDDDLLMLIARKLMVPPSLVYGVATFYHFFSLKPQGRHTCVVCMGTACYVKGSKTLIESAATLAGVKPGETTEDNSLSLLSARCLGACGIAPAVVLDGVVAGHVTEESLRSTLQEWMNGQE